MSLTSFIQMCCQSHLQDTGDCLQSSAAIGQEESGDQYLLSVVREYSRGRSQWKYFEQSSPWLASAGIKQWNVVHTCHTCCCSHISYIVLFTHLIHGVVHTSHTWCCSHMSYMFLFTYMVLFTHLIHIVGLWNKSHSFVSFHLGNGHKCQFPLG